jgi:hypothetical protein
MTSRMTMGKRIVVGGCLALFGQTASVWGQPAPDAWHVTVAPYLMAAGMNGTAGIGRLESDVNLSAGDVFSNLQFGFMGYAAAKKGKWGVGADIIWMALGSSADKPLPVNVDVDQGGFTFVAIRELSPYVDIRGGVLINTLHPKLGFKAPINRDLKRDETWVDPVIGVNLHTPDDGRRWGVAVFADVGGFGVGSDIMFNLQPVVLIGLTDRASLAVGYRLIYLNYENHGDDEQRRLLYKMTSSGPLLGFVFRF